MKIASKHEKNFDDFKYCAIYGELTTMGEVLCSLQYEKENGALVFVSTLLFEEKS